MNTELLVPGGRAGWLQHQHQQGRTVWRSAGMMTWVSVVDAGRERRVREWVPMPQNLRAPKSVNQMRVLAAVFHWHHVSTSQLGAWCDVESGRVSRLVRPLFDMGLIEWGYPSGDCHHEKVWRIGSFERFSEFVAMLPPATQRALTLRAGTDRSMSSGSNSAAHNLLAGEFALRLWENESTAMVVPERLVDSRRLIGRHVEWSARGDMLWVRSDGLRVIIEIQRTEAGLKKKVERWRETLEHLADVALVVVGAPFSGCRRSDIQRAVRDATTGWDVLVASRVAVGWWPDINWDTIAVTTMNDDTVCLSGDSQQWWHPNRSDQRRLVEELRPMFTTPKRVNR